jgi:hypothetical protein
VPRAWLADGEEIVIDGMKSHFGPVSLHVESRLSEGYIAAKITCTSEYRPKRVEIRLPHPDGLQAKSVTGGSYHAEQECVNIEDFCGEAEVIVRY